MQTRSGATRSDGDVVRVPGSVTTREAVLAASEADILFSCIDSAEGRHIADRLSTYFAMPLFDVGVAIPTEPLPGGRRRIAEVYGRVDYVYPGGSSLMDRGVYDVALLEAEYLARSLRLMRSPRKSRMAICREWRRKRRGSSP